MKDQILKGIIVVILFLIVLVGFSKILQDQKARTEENSKVTTDSEKFKKEYEDYNNKERVDDKGNYFQELSISKDNPMKYASIEDALKLLDKGTGILYFGYPTCPWCRNAVPVLLEAANQKGVQSIHYVNVNKIKNTFAIEDGKVVKKTKEKEGYYDLLEALDDVLDPYVLTSDGESYEVGEKRIYVPFMVFVKDGVIVGTHLGTVTLEGTQTKYDPLTDKQHEELLNIYLKYIEEIQSQDYCDEECE